MRAGHWIAHPDLDRANEFLHNAYFVLARFESGHHSATVALGSIRCGSCRAPDASFVRTIPDWKGWGFMTKKAVLVLGLAWPCACDPSGELGGAQQAAIGGPADPDPNITFNQIGLGVGHDRSRDPASA